MTSNIEPIAREITAAICRDSQMPEAEIAGWVEFHWPCTAAMLEAGVMDETGQWIEGKDWRRGLEAYRERFAASFNPKAPLTQR
jgi:hypothetical protein